MYSTFRVLIIAEAANPEWTSVPLVGWSHYKAISRITDAHLVTQVRNKAAIISAGLQEDVDFTALDSELLASPLYKVAKLLRGGTDRAWTIDTAISALSYYFFEQLVWKKFFRDKVKKNFNLVHRITPLSPTTPSILAKRLRAIGIPFVLGPLNGGVRWPREFISAQRQEGEWLSYVRNIHKVLPGWKATQKNASAIIVGSRQTWDQYERKYRNKLIYLPENGVDSRRFGKIKKSINPIIKAAFVGRLVPYKGCDMLIKAIAVLIKTGSITLDIFGDGPERSTLEQQVKDMGVQSGVKFYGFVENSLLQDYLIQSDIFVFPSIREFGGGAILEAMALGVVPVVVDYGGPGELVNESCGYLVQLGPREKIVQELALILENIIMNPLKLKEKSENCRARVQNLFTWEAKAAQIKQIYEWVNGHRNAKPTFGMPF